MKLTAFCRFLKFICYLFFYVFYFQYFNSFGVWVFWIERWSDLIIQLSVQFSRSVVSVSLQPHESQHTRPPCPYTFSDICWKIRTSFLIVCNDILAPPGKPLLYSKKMIEYDKYNICIYFTLFHDNLFCSIDLVSKAYSVLWYFHNCIILSL